MPSICVDLRLDDQVHCLALRGPIPLQEVEAVWAGAKRVAEGSAAVAVDLSEVEHMHAACLQVLLALRVEVEGQRRKFSVRAPSDAAKRTLRWAGLQSWLEEGEHE